MSGITAIASLKPSAAFPNPFGYWKFDDASGTTAVDSSGNGNNGTLHGSPLPTWTTGQFSGAIQFDGSQNWVDFGRPTGFVSPTALTLAAWVYPTSFPGGSLNFIAGLEYSYGIAFDSGYFIDGGVVNGNMAQINNGVALYTPVNTWHHICLTFGSATWTLYIDGVSRATTTSASIGSSIWDFTAGCLGGVGYQDKFFAGKLDELRYYNITLTSSQVTTLYNLIP